MKKINLIKNPEVFQGKKYLKTNKTILKVGILKILIKKKAFHLYLGLI